MPRNLLGEGKFEWFVTHGECRTEIRVDKGNRTSWSSYPDENLDDIELKLEIVRMLMSEFCLYGYKVEKQIYPKGTISFT